MKSDNDLALFILLLVTGAVLMGVGGIFHINALTNSIVTDPVLFQLGSISFLAGLGIAIVAIFKIYRLGQSR